MNHKSCFRFSFLLIGLLPLTVRAELPIRHSGTTPFPGKESVESSRANPTQFEQSLGVAWPRGNGFDYQGWTWTELYPDPPDLATYAQAKNPLRSCVSETDYTGNRSLPGHTLNPSNPFARLPLQRNAEIFSNPKNIELIQQHWNVVGHLGWIVGNEKLDRISGYVSYAESERDSARAAMAQLQGQYDELKKQDIALAQRTLDAYKTGDRDYYQRMNAWAQPQKANLLQSMRQFAAPLAALQTTRCLAEQLLDTAKEASAMRKVYQANHKLPFDFDPRFLVSTQRDYTTEQARSDYAHSVRGKGRATRNADLTRKVLGDKSWEQILGVPSTKVPSVTSASRF